MQSNGLEICRMQYPKLGFLPKPISLLKMKRGNLSRKNGPRKSGWTMIPNRTLEKKKLCFTCQEPWVPGHRCSGKGKAYYIEAYSDNGEDEDYQDQEQGETPETVKEWPPSGGTIATMIGFLDSTFWTRGTV